MTLDIKKMIAHKPESYEKNYTDKDAIIYSLGIGFQKDSQDESHFKYTYELADEFSAFPTNVVTLAHGGPLMQELLDVPGMPEFNLMKLLHGSEDVFIEKPLSPGKTYVMQEYIKDWQDKKSGALMILDTEIREKDTNTLQSTVRTSLFIMGQGGFGHKGFVKMPAYPEPPKRQPDFVAEEVTNVNQAFWYRLSGDVNPLHVDPSMAAMGGFKKPILHGLCTKGFTVRAVQQHFFKDDPSLMSQVSSKFTSHVFPGETLIVEMWKDGDTIIFTTKTKERGKTCLKGYLKLSKGAKL